MSPAVGSHSHQFSTALLALVPAVHEGLTSSEVVALALAAHHPAITRGVADKERAWWRAVGRMKNTKAVLAGGQGKGGRVGWGLGGW